MRANSDMPGHLARRFQQIAVAVFHAETEAAGYDLTPVQYAALAAIEASPNIDQATLAGMIAYDRTTITGVIDRLVRKALVTRAVDPRDRRARTLLLTSEGSRILADIAPAVSRAQRRMMSGLDDEEAQHLVRLLQKLISTGNELSRAPLVTAVDRQ